jgi:glycosyltransferase involved in cell wall biosynthesis
MQDTNGLHRELVSIIIPVLNEASTIENCIKEISAVAQDSGILHEIIVVDDGSSDNTYQILINLSQMFQNLKAIRFSVILERRPHCMVV